MTDSRKRRRSDLLASPESGSDGRLQALEALPEVAELKQSLRKLPEIEPDPAVWVKIQDRAGSKNAGPESGLAGGWTAPRFAIAAGLLLAVSAGILGVNVLRDGSPQTLKPNQVASLPVGNEAIQVLRARSRQLEPITQSYPSDPVVSAFRYRIADVDSQISSMPEGHLDHQEAQRLWGQRVALLESLAEVRRARAALQPAVY